MFFAQVFSDLLTQAENTTAAKAPFWRSLPVPPTALLVLAWSGGQSHLWVGLGCESHPMADAVLNTKPSVPTTQV